MPHFLDKKNVKLFAKHHIFTESEMHSRYEVSMENYSKTLNIEALTMIDMANKQILPAVEKYMDDLSLAFTHKKALNPKMNCHVEYDRVTKLSELSASVYDETEELKENVSAAAAITDFEESARAYKETVLPTMDALRTDADKMETLTGASYWPFPTYADLIYHV